MLGDLQERLRELVAGSLLEILRVRNTRLVARTLLPLVAEETLDDLDEHEVFARCLAVHGVPAEQQQELISVFHEALTALHEGEGRGNP